MVGSTLAKEDITKHKTKKGIGLLLPVFEILELTFESGSGGTFFSLINSNAAFVKLHGLIVTSYYKLAERVIKFRKRFEG